MSVRTLSIALLTISIGVAPIHAQTFLGADINSSTGVQSATAVESQTLGYSFTLSQPYYVASLGIWDLNGNGLANAHPVGLWTDTGTLLASVAVQSGTASTFVPTVASGFLAGSGWRFENLSSQLFLNAGTYRVGAFYANGSTDDYQFGVPTGQVDWAPGVSFGANHFSDSDLLTFPSDSNGTGFDVGVFGPNLILAVPEPTTWAMIILGGLSTAAGGLYYRHLRAKRLDQPSEGELAELTE